MGCNRQFKYTYIDKATQNQTDKTALLKGRAVHSILEHYPKKSTHKLASEYQYIVNKFIASKTGQKYFSYNSTREYSFGLNKKLEPCTYYDKDALFRGFIDYICIINNMLYIIDFKTGKYKAPRWQSYDQLMYYAIYFFRKYLKINTIIISYVYIEHADHENYITLSREHLNSYVEQLIKPIKSIEVEVEFNKNPNRLCEWCNFRTHCSKDI